MPLRWIIVRFSIHSRRKKLRAIDRFMQAHNARTIAIVGGLGSGTSRNEAIIEYALAVWAKVIASVDPTNEPRPTWPSIVGDGRQLPWRDQAVDLVVSNAVIEHVGDETDQRAFVAEHQRTGRDWIITTPNRWFPVESHTTVLLRHWSSRWRAQRTEFTRLMSLAEFRSILPPGTRIVGHPWSTTFSAYSR